MEQRKKRSKLLLAVVASAVLLLFTGKSFAQDVKPADDDKVYSTAGLDVLPEYPGGLGEFYKYIQKNMRIPKMEHDVNVNVYVSFIINKDGTMSDIEVARDPGYGLAEEAKRLMASLKEVWAPGILNGKVVRVRYMLPIKVNVKTDNKNAKKQ
ncbi:MAG: energy transducer TonB [Flavobacterium sp.]